VCNRYRMTAKEADLAVTFGIRPPYEKDEEYPVGDIFPTGKKTPFYGKVIVQDGAERKLERMEWGVPTQVPSARDPSVKLTKYVTNVRNLNSSFWRSMLTHWFDVPSRPIFAFAGIWRPTERGNAYGFLTTEPNAIVAPIHPKAMPVILHDDDYDRWLTAPWDELKDVVAPYPSQLMCVEGMASADAEDVRSPVLF
jgi:putative SOS response-associated peptidase YedK